MGLIRHLLLHHIRLILFVVRVKLVEQGVEFIVDCLNLGVSAATQLVFDEGLRLLDSTAPLVWLCSVCGSCAAGLRS